MAAAVPHASPIPTQMGITRKLECARCVPEMFRPLSSRPSICCGTRQPYGMGAAVRLREAMLYAGFVQAGAGEVVDVEPEMRAAHAPIVELPGGQNVRLRQLLHPDEMPGFADADHRCGADHIAMRVPRYIGAQKIDDGGQLRPADLLGAGKDGFGWRLTAAIFAVIWIFCGTNRVTALRCTANRRNGRSLCGTIFTRIRTVTM